MGLKRFFAMLAMVMSDNKNQMPDDKEMQKLKLEAGLRHKRFGGTGAFSQPNRIATPKSVKRFHSKITNPDVLEMRMKNVQRKQPAYRRMMRTQSIAVATV